MDEKKPLAKPQAGQHLLADLFEINHPQLADPAFIEQLCQDSLATLSLTLRQATDIQHFEHGGYGGVKIFDNAQISFHVQPAHHYVTLDIIIYSYTNPELVLGVWATTLKPQMIRKTTITRGLHS